MAKRAEDKYLEEAVWLLQDLMQPILKKCSILPNGLFKLGGQTFHPIQIPQFFVESLVKKILPLHLYPDESDWTSYNLLRKALEDALGQSSRLRKYETNLLEWKESFKYPGINWISFNYWSPITGRRTTVLNIEPERFELDSSLKELYSSPESLIAAIWRQMLFISGILQNQDLFTQNQFIASREGINFRPPLGIRFHKGERERFSNKDILYSRILEPVLLEPSETDDPFTHYLKEVADATPDKEKRNAEILVKKLLKEKELIKTDRLVKAKCHRTWQYLYRRYVHQSGEFSKNPTYMELLQAYYFIRTLYPYVNHLNLRTFYSYPVHFQETSILTINTSEPLADDLRNPVHRRFSRMAELFFTGLLSAEFGYKTFERLAREDLRSQAYLLGHNFPKTFLAPVSLKASQIERLINREDVPNDVRRDVSKYIDDLEVQVKIHELYFTSFFQSAQQYESNKSKFSFHENILPTVEAFFSTQKELIVQSVPLRSKPIPQLHEGIKMEVCDDEIEHIQFLGYPDLILHFLTVLLDNSLRALNNIAIIENTQRGLIQIYANRIEYKDQSYLRLCVVDRGNGIKAQRLKQIRDEIDKILKNPVELSLNPLQEAMNAGGETRLGMGLKLLAQNLRKQSLKEKFGYPGAIEINSEENQGTEITVDVPVKIYDI